MLANDTNLSSEVIWKLWGLIFLAHKRGAESPSFYTSDVNMEACVLLAAILTPWGNIQRTNLRMKPRLKHIDGKHIVLDDITTSLDQQASPYHYSVSNVSQYISSLFKLFWFWFFIHCRRRVLTHTLRVVNGEFHF